MVCIPPSAPERPTRAQLDARLDHVRQAPRDVGRLELIVRRPQVDGREVLAEGELSVEVGLVGDSWSQRPSSRTTDRRPHPDMQINVMSVRAAEAVAGPIKRWPLAGDQLFVDLDVSGANVPPGTRLAVGDAVLEVTAQPHTGCSKFAARFGADALAWVNAPEGRALNLRGINAKVVQAGRVRVGDVVRRLADQSVVAPSQ